MSSYICFRLLIATDLPPTCLSVLNAQIPPVKPGVKCILGWKERTAGSLATRDQTRRHDRLEIWWIRWQNRPAASHHLLMTIKKWTGVESCALLGCLHFRLELSPVAEPHARYSRHHMAECIKCGDSKVFVAWKYVSPHPPAPPPPPLFFGNYY